jgi:rhodanese-related sulfurtransferase
MSTTARRMVDEALTRVTSLDTDAARDRLGQPGVAFVDLREASEREAHGTIPGALHVPRGLLEFVFDPQSPWHRPALAGHRELVLFCAAGWRSALAADTLQQLGLSGVSHLRDGFAAWAAAGAPVGSASATPAPAAQASPPRID